MNKESYKLGSDTFIQNLQSLVKLEELEKITRELDEELVDSQRVMNDITALFDSIPNELKQTPVNITQEEISKFMDVEVPNLLMKDMLENVVDVDLDNVIAVMKGYAEDLKKKLVDTEPIVASQKINKNMESLEIEQYATSLDQLSKKLANIKLNNRDEVNKRNIELEGKLTQLCGDVDMFTQMVHAKSNLSQFNENWQPMQEDGNSLYYDQVVSKLLYGINEVTYLLKNKN